MSGPRGAFVVVVGPDGAGKTTLARAILAQHGGPVAYFHFLPPIATPLCTGPAADDQPAPHKGAPGGSRVLGCVRLARSFVWSWIAYALRVRPAVKRGTLVVGDRWVYGYVAQPHALRFYGPARLASAMVRLLPNPDLVVNLRAAPDVIRGRKQELTVGQIEHELDAWTRVPASRLRTFASVDSPDTIARRVRAELDR